MIQLRDLDLDDSALLAQLHFHTFEQPWSFQDFQKLLQNGATCGYIAYHKELPIGFILAQVAVDQADILTFCVIPKYRRCGVGYTLLTQLQKFLEAQGVKELHLEVREENVPAINLYIRCGFTQVGRRKGYYQLDQGGKMDALLMFWSGKA
jgi:[ribosomal protein S18]-alanine N-acetyltransferase